MAEFGKEDAPIWRGGLQFMWEELGRLQFDFLLEQGLKPEQRLLDVGCGCLRAGIHFIPYLADGHYYGIDSDHGRIEAARERELELAGLSARRVSLLCRDDFGFHHFGVLFDFALAQSVFTHLPWNSILRCLVEVRKSLAPNGKFFATFFEDVDGLHRTASLMHSPGDIRTFPDSDPYHYEFSVFEDLARRAHLSVENIGGWNHPRAQRMMLFRPVPTVRRLD